MPGNVSIGDLVLDPRKFLYLKSLKVLICVGLFECFDIASQVEKLLEAVAEYDESLMEKFFEDPDSISEEEINAALRAATIDLSIIPMTCGSSFKNKGVQFMLDAVCKYLPSPMDKEGISGIHPNDAELLEEDQTQLLRKPDVKEPFAALAFKIMTDPFVGQLTFTRIYRGILESGTYVLNSTKMKKERIGRLLKMHANSREEVKELYAGEIGAVVGLKDTITGDTLASEKDPVILERMDFPEPVISVAVEPKTKADQEKMGMALKKLSDEDPTFRISSNQETGETIISGMGELHLEIMVDRMKREFGVEANVGKPQVSYRETIQGSAEEEYKYIKQSGGKGQYGHVKITIKPIEPLAEGAKIPKNVHREDGFEFVDSIKGGVIPQEFIPAVEKGVKEAMDRGIVAGFTMTGVSCELTFGSYHDVDSSEIAYKIAASQAFQAAAKRARPVILEPIMKVEVVSPEQFMGDCTGSLSSKRGQIEGMEDRGMNKAIRAMVPLSEMFGYTTELRSMTQGRGSMTMEFDHYDVVPPNVEKTIVESRK